MAKTITMKVRYDGGGTIKVTAPLDTDGREAILALLKEHYEGRCVKALTIHIKPAKR